jgi:predicted ATPase/class 3 adenylate cyclase
VSRMPPTGTVGLLFTDMEDSTRLARALGGGWLEVVDAHDALLSTAIDAHGGYIERTEGDAFFAVFESAEAGARAAVCAQRAVRDHRWPQLGEVRVRMGLHVGQVERSRMGYVGLEIHRAARVAAAAHGGQLLLTLPAARASEDAVETDMLGAYRLKDFPVPEALFCARIDGLGADSFPPPRTLDLRPTNLPAGRPPLIGREDEAAAVLDAIGRSRVVTLTGRGGAGKTSLALVAGTEALDAHVGGVWWVELASVSNDGFLAAIAAATHAQTRADERLLDALTRRFEARGSVLLVLDNMEHLLSSTRILAELLDRAPDVRILSTSQAPLRLPSEVVVPVGPLSSGASLNLFDAGAARARSGRGLADAERIDADAICQALDGLPLAIELSAARVAVLTLPQLRERLGGSLDLVRGNRALPERQRSLEATVDWTLEMLDKPARVLFERLGAFAGPAELEELEAVAGADDLDVLGSVSALIEFSLLSRVEIGDGRVRFGLPAALRRVAAARLDASPDAQRWYEVHARRQLARSWPARLVHMDTIREYETAADAEPEVLLAIERMANRDRALVDALRAVVGLRLINIGRIGEAAPLLRSLEAETIEDPAVRAVVRFAHGMQALFSGGGSQSFDLALDLAQGADASLTVTVRALRSVARLADGNPAAAVADAAAATELAIGIGGPVLAGALLLEAQARLAAGEIEHARLRLRKSAELSATCDATAAWHQDSISGDIAFNDDQLADALRCFSQSLQAAETRRDVQQVAYDLMAVAGTLARLGHDHAAAELIGIIDTHCGDAGATREQMLPVATGLDEARAAADRLGGAAAFAVEQGAAVAPGQRVARALGLAATALESMPNDMFGGSGCI